MPVASGSTQGLPTRRHQRLLLGVAVLVMVMLVLLALRVDVSSFSIQSLFVQSNGSAQNDVATSQQAAKEGTCMWGKGQQPGSQAAYGGLFSFCCFAT